MAFAITFLLLALALLVWAWFTAIDKMNSRKDDCSDWSKGRAPWENDEWDNQHHNEDV